MRRDPPPHALTALGANEAVRCTHRSLACAVVVFAAWVAVPMAAGLPRTCEESESPVLVQVHGVRSSQGALVAVLYGDNPADFLKKGKRLASERVPARTGSVTLCLEASRPGRYALAVYHDENDNKRFDRSWMGLPEEGFGVSNNPGSRLRAPTHAEATFEVGAGRTVVSVVLRY
jgi:uncharacterized protein (DUF2141 family)